MSASGPSITPDFQSIAAADRTYFGGQKTDKNNDGKPDRTGWGKPTEVPTDWKGGWTLVKQARIEDSSQTRFLVIRGTGDGTTQALNEGGVAKDVTLKMPLEGVPTFNTEQDARAAYQAWLEEQSGKNGKDGKNGEGSTSWTEWSKVTKVPPWVVWGRESKSGDKMQMLAASTLADGTAVYLQPDGSVGEQVHIFSGPDALKKALNAYRSKVKNGEIPEERRPTGNSPNQSTIASDAAKAPGATRASASSGSGGLVSWLTSPTGMVAAAVVAAILVYAYREGYFSELTDSSGGIQT